MDSAAVCRDRMTRVLYTAGYVITLSWSFQATHGVEVSHDSSGAASDRLGWRYA